MKRLSLHLTFYILLSTLLQLKGQSDSLLLIWSDPEVSDSLRVAAYTAYHGLDVDPSRFPENAVDLAQPLVDGCKAMGYDRGLAWALSIQGRQYLNQGELDKADSLLTKAASIRYTLPSNQDRQLAELNLIQLSYQKSEHMRSLSHAKRLIELSESISDTEGVCIGLGMQTLVLGELGFYEQAFISSDRCIRLAEARKDTFLLSQTLTNRANIFFGLEKFKEALPIYQRIIELTKDIEDEEVLTVSRLNLANCQWQLGDKKLGMNAFMRVLASPFCKDNLALSSGIWSFMGTHYYDQERMLDSAEFWLRKSIPGLIETGQLYFLSSTYNKLGQVFVERKEGRTALQFCHSGRVTATQVGILKEQKKACDCLADAHRALLNHDSAYYYLSASNRLNDSINASEALQKASAQDYEYQLVQDSLASALKAERMEAEHQAEIQTQDELRNWTITGGLLAVLLAIGFYSRWRLVQKSKAGIEAEKERSDALLLNILPAETATELKEKGYSEAKEFKEVTVLFTDFKGFTEMASHLKAQDLVNDLNECFSAFDQIMAKYKIEKIKTIGDAYMAAGGLSDSDKDHAKRTALAALDMAAFIEEGKQRKQAENLPYFEIRIGLNTGPVVAGIVGLKKFQYDIWGDTVNIASRMESHGEVGKVNLSATTYFLLKDEPDLRFQSRGSQLVKGKGEMEMWFVESL